MQWNIYLEIKHTLTDAEINSIESRFKAFIIDLEKTNERTTTFVISIKRHTSRGAMAFVISLFSGMEKINFISMKAKPCVGESHE